MDSATACQSRRWSRFSRHHGKVPFVKDLPQLVLGLDLGQVVGTFDVCRDPLVDVLN